MPIKIVQLNIERDKHFERFIPFLQSQNADIICLQEVLQHDVVKIEEALNMKGFYTTVAFHPESEDVQGQLMLSKHKMSDVEFIPYARIVNRSGEKYTHTLTKLIVHADKEYTIMTTHYLVTPDGEIDENQKQAWKTLKPILEEFSTFILAGDFNAPRGKEMFTKFTSIMTDNLPPEVENTLDPLHHKKPHLCYAVDNIFSKNMTLRDVTIHDDVSDHKALVGFIE